MGHRDAEGIHLSEENWAKISVDTMGFSSEKLIRALEAQLARKQEKEQATASLAPACAYTHADRSGPLGTARHSWFMDWYYKLGFSLQIPVPPVSDAEYEQRQPLGQELFYRPASSDLSASAQAGVSYDALMKAVGQSEHWTLIDKNDRKKIVWESAKAGYWFWAEVAPACPRLGSSWNKLVHEQKLCLLSLEEYAIVWWAHQAAANIMLDIKTWSWLRTRFGSGALYADECDGWVRVGRWCADALADSYGGAGGRAAEVVKR